MYIWIILPSEAYSKSRNMAAFCSELCLAFSQFGDRTAHKTFG